MTPAELSCVLLPWLAQQAGGDDPAAVREQVRKVMSRPAYHYEPSFWERLSRRLSDWLERLLSGVKIPGAPATFGGGASSLVAWVVIVLALAVGVFAVVRAVQRRVRTPVTDDSPTTTTEIEHARRAKDWADDATRFEREGRWKEAVQARYRELVRTLVDRGQLPDVAGRTTGELRGDLHRTTPTAAAAFDQASTTFELAWYAELPVDSSDVASLRVAATDVLAAPHHAAGNEPAPPPLAGQIGVTP